VDDAFVGESGEAAEQPEPIEVPQVEASEPVPKPLSELVPEVVSSDAPETVAVEDAAEAGFDARVAEIAASLDTASFEPVASSEPVAAEDASEVVQPVVELDADNDGAQTVSADADDDAEAEAESDEAAVDAAAPATGEGAEPELAVAADGDDVPAAVVVPDPKGAAWWPFIVLAVLWLAFAGTLGWLMYSAPAGVPSVEVAYYQYTILAGIALTLFGPLLAVVLFFNGRDTVEPRTGFFATLLLRASLVTLAGVVVWWIVLIGADAYRLGRLL